jgi:hypothetical protein
MSTQNSTTDSGTLLMSLMSVAVIVLVAVMDDGPGA